MRRRKVFCAGCAHLFCIGGAPLCVASARFKEGPLRARIDVVDVVSAEKRNIRNDCTRRANVSLRAWELKKWLLWRLNDGDTIRSEDRIEEKDLSNYKVKKEYERKREILEKTCGRDHQEDGETFSYEGYEGGSEEETFKDASEEKSRESLLDDGGVDDNDGDSAADQSIGEVVQDPGDVGGLGGEYVPQDESGVDD